MSTFSKIQTDSKHASLMAARLVLTVIASGTMLLLDTVTPLGLAIWLLQVTLVWITSLWANPRQMLAVAVVCSLFVVLAFWFSPKTGLEMWVALSNLFLSLGAIWAITHTCLLQRAAEDARRKAAEELAQSQATVSILSGLLPICAWCKKIRNEAGAWEDLETYMLNHSQAKFTHGVCQECAARLSKDWDREGT